MSRPDLPVAVNIQTQPPSSPLSLEINKKNKMGTHCCAELFKVSKEVRNPTKLTISTHYCFSALQPFFTMKCHFEKVCIFLFTAKVVVFERKRKLELACHWSSSNLEN
ncbi:hypothetical protein ES332_D07G174000v1 [Gossypium tomentosum]|uniref:Uncharacterized protein n=1 Tax=Gossypium tomentosum TaxID=34277 RepID=A0A5D2K9D7_GOSTO|nr:hypothetical protein ES332_D07G174000v1 [Gossypium tomentosum]